AEDDAREVVFRDLMGRPAWLTSFLQVEGEKDPSWYLLDRLADHWSDTFQTGVKPFSAGRTTTGGTYDRATGDRGVVYEISSLQWAAEGRCHVEGAHYFDGLAAAGNSYEVRLQEGRWVIEKVVNVWIS